VATRTTTLCCALAAAVVVGALAGTTPVADAQAPTTPTRMFTARDVELLAGEAITIHLHPNEVPIQLHATSRAALEVCPEGWPSFTGFLTCLPIAAGAATLPSTVVNTFHLGFTVRAVGGAPARIRKLTVTYAPTDGYFLVDPAPVAPGRATPTFSFAPRTTRVVGVGAYTQESDLQTLAPDAKVHVTQQGTRVRTSSAPPPGGGAPAYGPVRLDQPVVVRVRNRGSTALALALEVAWD
jgi:hypothetical protein